MAIKTTRILLSALTLALPLSTLAATPLGTWRTIDDATGQAKSLVSIRENNGLLTGTVSQILNPAKRNTVCALCKDERKDKKIEGMTILWDMKKKKENQYEGGKILDPASGKIYSANMKLLENGQTLEVRGYIGFSLIGRSQQWQRVD